MRQPPRPGGDSAERRQPACLAALLGFLESAVKGDRHPGNSDRVLLAEFPAVDLPVQPRNVVIDRAGNRQLGAFPGPGSEVGAHGWFLSEASRISCALSGESTQVRDRKSVV